MADIAGPVGRRVIKQPNVILVFSDDQRCNSSGMTGDPFTQTPNHDLCNKNILTLIDHFEQGIRRFKQVQYST